MLLLSICWTRKVQFITGFDNMFLVSGFGSNLQKQENDWKLFSRNRGRDVTSGRWLVRLHIQGKTGQLIQTNKQTGQQRFIQESYVLYTQIVYFICILPHVKRTNKGFWKVFSYWALQIWLPELWSIFSSKMARD